MAPYNGLLPGYLSSFALFCINGNAGLDGISVVVVAFVCVISRCGIPLWHCEFS